MNRPRGTFGGSDGCSRCNEESCSFTEMVKNKGLASQNFVKMNLKANENNNLSGVEVSD